jgi:F-type H+-transporting ATPase subunit alpha
VAGDLRLAYSQFNELEAFARFGTRLDEETQQTLRRGRRVREVLKQPESRPIPVPEQVAVLLATTEGLLDSVPVDRVSQAAAAIREQVRAQAGEISTRITSGEELGDEDRNQLVRRIREQVAAFTKEPNDGDTRESQAQG